MYALYMRGDNDKKKIVAREYKPPQNVFLEECINEAVF